MLGASFLVISECEAPYERRFKNNAVIRDIPFFLSLSPAMI
jgi:hypothetical protein